MPAPNPPAPLDSGKWSGLNLILTVATVLITALMFAFYINRRKDEETGDANYDANAGNLPGVRLASAAASVAAVLLFVLTQDMSLKRGFADQWTIWHIVIAAATAALAFFGKR